MTDARPNPETLLHRIQNEEEKARQGKLKIYLGAAPGVGKTYEMLRDAFAERNKGLDVVIGVAESHGRDEINFMIKDFEALPPQQIDYHGHKLVDFDIDAALRRNPGLILIDEMAHTNAPGLRHAKRWQDIKELLDRGINVYTTLNVQHIESLNDDVAQIIHAPVKETVPDVMLELADSIELVDIPPEELLKRLQDGKIYYSEQAELAAEYFFRIGNLVALRAMALRVTAQRVGAQVLSYRHDQNITQIWPIKEKILVCIGPGAESKKLIRAGCRMATSLQAEWMAVYVETPRLFSSEDIKNNAIENLRFAQQMGAETRFLTGFDIVKEVMKFAHDQNVTQIMVWKTLRTRPWDLFFRRLADELVRDSGEIDIYIMTGAYEKHRPTGKHRLERKISWPSYAITISIVAFATLINLLLYPYLSLINLIMVYLSGIVLVCHFGRQGPPILASFLSTLLFYYFFVPSPHTLGKSDVQYLLTLLVMLLVVQQITHLTIIKRRQAEAALASERQMSALYNLSRQLARTRGIENLLETGMHFISSQFDNQAMAFISEKGLLVFKNLHTKETLSAKEQSIAQWVFDLGQAAGLGTDTLPFAGALYLPITGSKGSLGVIRIRPKHLKRLFTPEQMHLLEACANQIALAIEADYSESKPGQSALSRKNYMNNALLQSIAHEFKSSLAAIMVSASNQMEMAEELSPRKVKKLGETFYFESEQLNRLINNFFQITWLDSKTATVTKEYHSLRNTIQKVLELAAVKLGKRPVVLDLPKTRSEYLFDEALIQDVLNNLIDNVIKFTPAKSSVYISAVEEKGMVTVSVEDEGPGIMPDEADKLFEKFYRGRMLKTRQGLALGLAICKSIIRLHGGKIWAENRKEGGAAFRFSLPTKRAI